MTGLPKETNPIACLPSTPLSSLCMGRVLSYVSDFFSQAKQSPKLQVGIGRKPLENDVCLEIIIHLFLIQL